MEKKLFINEICEQSIKKISEGDLSALTVVYDCVGKLLFSIAFSILNDYQLSEDVMHDTFLKIAEQAKMYRRNSNAKAWIASICRNAALNTLKKRKYEAPSSGDTIEADINLSLDNEINTFELFDILTVLSLQEREIVIFKVLWRFSHDQIAKLMNLSTANTRQKYKRALDKLRNIYKEE